MVVVCKRGEFHYYGIPSPERARIRVRASGDARGVDMTRDVSHATLTVALAGTSFSSSKPKDLQLRIYLEVFVVV